MKYTEMFFIFHFGNAYNYSDLYMWKLTTSCPPHRGKDFRPVQVLTHHLIEKSQLCKNKIKWNERSLQLGLSPSSIFKANKLKSWNSWCCFLYYAVYPFTANGPLRSQIWGLWGQLTLIHFFCSFIPTSYRGINDECAVYSETQGRKQCTLN